MVLQTEAVHSQHSFIQFIHSFIKKPNVHTTLRYFKWFEWHGFQPGFALQTEAVRSQHSFIHSVHSLISQAHMPHQDTSNGLNGGGFEPGFALQCVAA